MQNVSKSVEHLHEVVSSSLRTIQSYGSKFPPLIKIILQSEVRGRRKKFHVHRLSKANVENALTVLKLALEKYKDAGFAQIISCLHNLRIHSINAEYNIFLL